MADVNALAESARKKLQSGEANSEVNAIRKAIVGVGITDKADVHRLMSQVGTAVARKKFQTARRCVDDR